MDTIETLKTAGIDQRTIGLVEVFLEDEGTLNVLSFVLGYHLGMENIKRINREQIEKMNKLLNEQKTVGE